MDRESSRNSSGGRSIWQSRPTLWVGLVAVALAVVLIATIRMAPVRMEPPAAPDPAPSAVPDPAPAAEPMTTARRASQPELDRTAERRAMADLSLAQREARIRQLLAGTTAERLFAVELLVEGVVRDPVPLMALALDGPERVVRAAALRGLAPHGSHDRRAREAMVGFLATDPSEADDRAVVFQVVLEAGVREETEALSPMLLEETEPDVVVAAARALTRNIDPAVRVRVSSLHWRHSDPDVRRRLRALGIGR